MQMFTSARYSAAHYLLHAVPPVSANAYMHFERNFRHGHVQLYCLTQWILTRAGQCEGLQHWRGRDNPNLTHSTLLFDTVDIDPGGSV